MQIRRASSAVCGIDSLRSLMHKNKCSCFAFRLVRHIRILSCFGSLVANSPRFQRSLRHRLALLANAQEQMFLLRHSARPPHLHIKLCDCHPYNIPQKRRLVNTIWKIKCINSVIFCKNLLTNEKKVDILLWQVDNHTCGEVLKW